MNPNFIAYLISLGASITWDILKKILSTKDADDSNRKMMMAVASTMREFYIQMDFEYDEFIVMNSFLSAIHDYKDLKWHLRDVIECTVGQGLEDDQFQLWVDIYSRYVPWTDKPFVVRNQTLTRIKNTLCVEDECSYGNFIPIIKSVCCAFNTSWKQEIIDILPHSDIDFSFVQGPEKYDVLLSYFRSIDIEYDQLENVRTLQDLLEHPHFNKVLLVCGTSGAGKTHFINEYIRVACDRLDSIPVPCHVHLNSVKNISSDILDSLRSFLGVECASLKEYSYLLDALSINICFVIEDIEAFLNDNWDDVVFTIEDTVRFDTYTFIISINEYEYYQLENDQEFLERYCIKVLDQSFFGNCFSVNEFNASQNVIGQLLEKEYDVISEFENELSTPQEAIYYGECVRDENEISPPSSYYEYIEKITQWKEKLVDFNQLKPILNAIVDQKSNIIQTNCDVSSFRKAQLLTKENMQSIFSFMQAYHLRIYPYWATKIIGMDPEGILSYSKDLREWLVSCYIFYRYQEIGVEIDDLDYFFKDLHRKNILEYAAFCAYRADVRFKRELCNYLLSIEIDTPRLCYAVLRFVDQCSIAFSDKLALCTHMAEKINDYELLEMYSRALDRILSLSKSIKSLKKNMLSLVNCSVQNFNHVNGYRFGNRYMILSRIKNVHDLVWNIVLYIEQHQLEDAIDHGNNHNFLDYFLRKCLEYYISYRHEELLDIYTELEPIFIIDSVVGPYAKRNLTCAAGNIFASGYDRSYRNEYIKVAEEYKESFDLYNRLTAWFLVCNSVSEQDDILDEQLQEVLDELMDDAEVVEKVGNEMYRFMSEHL